MSNRDISIASFNLKNLQAPGSRIYYSKRNVSQREYEEKIEWTASILESLDADVVAFQELWRASCLVDAFEAANLSADYELVFLKPSWRNTAVALAVRKPWKVDRRRFFKKLPYRSMYKPDLEDGEDDEIKVLINRFSRAVLEVTIRHSEDTRVPQIHVFAAHLKSKLATKVDISSPTHRDTVGSAISTIRRTAEAAGLRWILTNRIKNTNVPVVLVGDLNDDPRSNTLAILTQQPSLAASATGSDVALYNTLQLQQLSSFRDVFYTHEYKGLRDTLDHVLVSEQFFSGSPDHHWSLSDVRIWNDYIDDVKPDTSDHGVIRARFKWSAH